MSFAAAASMNPTATVVNNTSTSFPPPASSENSFPPATRTSSSVSVFDPMMSMPQHQPQQLNQQQQQHFQQPYPHQQQSQQVLQPPTYQDASAVNGLFLGLEGSATTNTNQAFHDEQQEEDRELRQAQEAALYAEGILRRQKEDREKARREGGLLGFGLLPKAQTFLQTKQQTWSQQMTQTQEQTNRELSTPQRNYQESYGDDGDNVVIQVDDVEFTGNGDTAQEKRPPWFQAKKAPQQQPTSGNDNGNSKDSEKMNKPGAAAAIGGAAALGGVAGLIVLGPIAGVVAAGAIAIQAARGGDNGIARGTGRVVATAGSAAKRFEDKHGVGKKAGSGLIKGIGWAVSAANSATKD
jgi:hypothetical protein